MENSNELILTQADYQKLSSLIESARYSTVELLDVELSRAKIVPDNELPNDVVAMNSKVRFKDMETGQETEVTLVYPHEADIQTNKVSVLAPVGSALIGLRVGQTIQWPFPNGKDRQLQVIAVFPQSKVDGSAES